jgi:hypothetical protein
VFLDRLDLVKRELPTLGHLIVWESGKREGPDPSLPNEPLAALMTAGDGEPDGVPPSSRAKQETR